MSLSASSSFFAGTSEGVFWTNDRGGTWSRFEPALREPVHSIALDSTGRFLYAGTEKGVYTLERSFERCGKGPDRLCLLGGTYEVSLTARRRGTAVPFPGRAIEEGDRFGYFSFPDVTGDPTFPEVFVKMVDASGAPPPYGGSVWVFHSSLTDLEAAAQGDSKSAISRRFTQATARELRAVAFIADRRTDQIAQHDGGALELGQVEEEDLRHRDAELPQAGEPLRGEGFVQLEEVDVGDGDLHLALLVELLLLLSDVTL